MNLTHRSRSHVLLVLGGLAWAASGCGNGAPVELPVSQIENASSTSASTDGDVAPPEEPLVEEPVVEEPVVEEPVVDEPAEEEVVAEEHGDEPAEPAPSPDPAYDEPDLVVDEDGCVTDRNLGLVIMCEDPAAGPDEGLG